MEDQSLDVCRFTKKPLSFKLYFSEVSYMMFVRLLLVPNKSTIVISMKNEVHD